MALAPLLIADLGLSRAQVGLLVGLAFMAVYGFGTLLSGVLADRWPRPRLIAAGLGAWSAATALTGTASGFASLAAWRALVGIGEATLPPSALSMIGDRVPSARVGLANGLFYAGVPVGFALSFALAGFGAPRFGWRACFLALGAAGLVGVATVWRDGRPAPARGLVAPGGRPPRRRPARRSARVASGPPSRWSSSARRCSSTRARPRSTRSPGSSRSADSPSRGRRSSRRRSSSPAGLAGNLVIGVLTDRARRLYPGARLVALGLLGGLGLAAAATFYRVSPASPLFYPAWFLAQAWLLGWYGAAVAAIDEMAPPGLRASVLGLGLLVVNLVGVASGAYLTGLVGDRASLTAGLTWSLAPAALGAALLVLVGLARLIVVPRGQVLNRAHACRARFKT